MFAHAACRDLVGGALSITGCFGNAIISNATFISNSAMGSGGAIIAQTCGLRLNGSVLTNNTAGYHGAALYVTDTGSMRRTPPLLDLYNTSLYDNRAGTATSGDGGAVYAQGMDLAIDSSRFAGNAASSSGGALAALYCSTVLVLRSELHGNEASTYGGAAYVAKSSLVAFVRNEWDNNTVDGDGGALSLDRCTYAVTATNVYRGNVAARGGALHLRPSGVLPKTMSAATIETVKSFTDIVVLDVSPVAKDVLLPLERPVSQYSRRRRSLIGGGELVAQGDQLQVAGTAVAAAAADGGMELVDGNATLYNISMIHVLSTFQDNYASGMGGAVALEGGTGTVLLDMLQVGSTFVKGVPALRMGTALAMRGAMCTGVPGCALFVVS